MFDVTEYKQRIWREYNDLFNRYSSLNNSYSVNVRLIHLDAENSVWDNIGGALENWSSRLTQLNWKIYENVPLFQNSPSVSNSGSEIIEPQQLFTATMKFILEPLPNDMVMYYEDPSNQIYKIDNINFHKTIQKPLKLFECELSTAPVDTEALYDNLNVVSHDYFNVYNNKLYDFSTWIDKYQPVLDDIRNIEAELKSIYNYRDEYYSYLEINQIIKDIVRCSHFKGILDTPVPFGNFQNTAPAPQDYELLTKLRRLKEILC